jgi:diacylglycerol kinase family enzyme
VPGAIDAFTGGVERRIDMAEVNGRLFLNNVSLGIYGDAIRQPARSRPTRRPGRPPGAQSQWQSVKADAAAIMRDLQGRIEHKRDEADVKMAEQDAEEDAVDALTWRA